MAARSHAGKGDAALPYRIRKQAWVDDILLLSRLAVEEYAERRRRTQFFDAELFGEPAWDMLLDLFIADVAGRRLSVTAVCYGSASSASTALRWIKSLESQGLVERRGDKADKRRSWVMLTQAGDRAMRRYLIEQARQRTGREVVSGSLSSGEPDFEPGSDPPRD